MKLRWFRNALIAGVLLGIGGCATAPRSKSPDGQTPAEINTQLGIEYLRKGMYEASAAKLNKAISQDSSYAPAHDAIAILYEQVGEVEKADTHYRRSLSLDGNNTATLNNYGQFLCRTNRLEEADRYFQQALKDSLYRYPEMINTNAGICAARVPDPRRAENYLRRALEASPNYLPAIREMARLNFAGNNYLGARAYIQRYEQQARLTADLLWIAVQTEDKLGDRNAAASYAMRLKNGFPDSAQAFELSKWENERNR